MMEKLLHFEGTDQHGSPFTQLLTPGDGFEKTAASLSLSDEVKAFMAHLKPEPGHTYVLNNALGAEEIYGSNINGDGFPTEALLNGHEAISKIPPWDVEGRKAAAANIKFGYPTFYTAHIFQHHVNKDPSKTLGKIILATWNAKMRRVEVIFDLDHSLCEAQGAMGLISKIEAGDFPSTSMGCKVPYDRCSICGNLAKTRADYCEHVNNKDPRYGMNKILPDGRRAYVHNDHPRFFDDSFVVIGADKTAFVMAKLAGKANSVFTESGASLPSALRGELFYGQPELEKAASVEKATAEEKKKRYRAQAASLGLGAAVAGLMFTRIKGPTAESVTRARRAARKLRPSEDPKTKHLFPSHKVVLRAEMPRPKLDIADKWKEIRTVKKASLTFERKGESYVEKTAAVDFQATGRHEFVSKGLDKVYMAAYNKADAGDPKKYPNPHAFAQKAVLQHPRVQKHIKQKGLNVGGVQTGPAEGIFRFKQAEAAEPGEATRATVLEQLATEKLAREEKEAAQKISEILKKLPAGTSSILKGLENDEPDIPNKVLDGLAGAPSLRDALSAPTAMGMVLKPREFQRIALVHSGRRGLADDYDNRGVAFRPHLRPHCGCLPFDKVGPPAPSILHMLRPLLEMIRNRSVASPVMEKRITLVFMGRPPAAKPVTEESDPVLDKLATAYSDYRYAVINSIPDMAESFETPTIKTAILSEQGVDLGSGIKQSSVPAALKLLALVGPLIYLSSAHLTTQRERGEDLGPLDRLVMKHPTLLTALAVGGGGRVINNPKGALRGVQSAIEALRRGPIVP